MAFQSTTDGAMVVMRFNGTQGPWANILWFSKPDFTVLDQEVLANLVFVEGTTDWSNVHSSANYFDRVEVYDMRTSSGPVVVTTDPVIPFGGSGGPMPLSACAVLTLRTSKRGRSYRGRLYLAGFHEGAWDGTQWQAAVGQSWTNWFGDMKLAADVLGWTWGVRSGQENGIIRSAAVVTPIINFQFRNLDSASQRRRNRRP